jgi:hypothetical protein
MKKLTQRDIERMRSILIDNIKNQYWLDKMEQSDKDNIEYIKTLDTYQELLDEFLINNEISGLTIYEQSSFLDPKDKFSFSTYDKKECEEFRDYIVKEYGVKRSHIE